MMNVHLKRVPQARLEAEWCQGNAVCDIQLRRILDTRICWEEIFVSSQP
jgi:hypothetical protein